MTRTDELAASLNRLTRLFGSRTVQATYARAADLSLSQQAIQVMRALQGTDGIPVTDVARLARMDVGAVSRQLRSLEDAGYLERTTSATDGSVVLVRATDDGRAAIGRLTRVGRGHLERTLHHWSEQDRQALTDLLDRFVTDLQSTPVEPPS